MLSALLLADVLLSSPCLLLLMPAALHSVCQLQVPSVTYCLQQQPALCMVPCLFVLVQHLICCSNCVERLLPCFGADLNAPM